MPYSGGMTWKTPPPPLSSNGSAAGSNSFRSAEAARSGPRRHRTLWISDVHLGTWGSKASLLIDFLKHNDAETLYLVGDIVDGWWLRRVWHWPQTHNDVVQKILRKARKGTKVIFLPGNHDEMARDFLGLSLGGIKIHDRVVHSTADGRRLLVLHGDQFDGLLNHAQWLSLLGSGAYEVALGLNHVVNAVRRKFGLPYWSLASFLKHKTKKAVGFMNRFEETVAREARRLGVDGVVCGHIHRPEIRTIDGILYANDGDWVESCTALAEDFQGRLEILRWPSPAAAPAPRSASTALSHA